MASTFRQLIAAMDLLPAGQLAERYHQTLRLAVLRLSNDREVMKALFGAAMIDGADLPHYGRDQRRASFGSISSLGSRL